MGVAVGSDMGAVPATGSSAVRWRWVGLAAAAVVPFAAAFVISYVAFSVPAVIAGFAGTAFGLRITAEVYALAIIATAAAALLLRVAKMQRADGAA